MKPVRALFTSHVRFMRMWCLVLLIYLVMHTDRCISDVSEAVLCKFDPEYADLQRVWCKQDSEDCCTGYAFGESITALYNGSVEVNNTANAFTITVHNLTEGNGMYWCGLMFSNETIMKLAEKYFSEDPSLFEQVWSILRLVLFAVLVLAFVSTCMLTRVADPNKKKVTDDGYENVALHGHRRRGRQASSDNTVTEE